MLALLAGLFISYLLGAIYSLWINPEIRFWKEAYKKKIEWADNISENGQPKLVFIGGSSTAFQIDAELLTAAGIPTVNMGMHAGMGTKANAAFGLSSAKPGDTVIWAFEIGRMSAPPEITALGYQALLATGVMFGSGLEKVPLSTINWLEALQSLRPGLAHTASMIAKILSGGHLYRYQVSLIRPGGSITTDERREVGGADIAPRRPDEQTIRWITKMTSFLDRYHSSSAYLLPLEYYSPGDRRAGQLQNRRFLQELSHTLPVVPDPALGVETDKKSFADTVSHLTEAARLQRTRHLIPIFQSISRNDSAAP
jgi:hypothetical protein